MLSITIVISIACCIPFVHSHDTRGDGCGELVVWVVERLSGVGPIGVALLRAQTRQLAN